MKKLAILVVAVVAFGGCYAWYQNDTAPVRAADDYVSDLEDQGYGRYFVSDRAAVAYAQNYCAPSGIPGEEGVPDGLDHQPADALDRLVAEWCDNDDLMGVELSRISIGD